MHNKQIIQLNNNQQSIKLKPVMKLIHQVIIRLQLQLPLTIQLRLKLLITKQLLLLITPLLFLVQIYKQIIMPLLLMLMKLQLIIKNKLKIQHHKMHLKIHLQYIFCQILFYIIAINYIKLSPLVLALFENPETCNPNCIAQCGKLSLQVTDQEMTSCFKLDCGCAIQSKEYEQINNTAMSSIPMAKNFYNYYLADQRASSLMELFNRIFEKKLKHKNEHNVSIFQKGLILEFQAGLISASQNMNYVTQMRNLNQQQSTHEDQPNLAEFSTYQIFIIVFFIIVSSIALVFFVKRHFFECEEGDKLLRQKYIRYQEQMEKSIYGRNASQSDAKYHKLQRN